MKGLMILLVSFIFSANLWGNTEWFMPRNNLWKEDSFFRPSNITKERFLEIIQIAKKMYDPVAKAYGEKLTINANWDDATVNASCSKFFGTITINMYGGLARRPEVTQDGFALVLCHELGHAFAGFPYANSFLKLSAEGESDYYGTKVCQKSIFTALEIDEDTFETTEFTEKTCTEQNENKEDYVKCTRSLASGISVNRLFAKLMTGQEESDYETPDPTEVSSTLPSYPETIQCRLDTYLAGTIGDKRPLCWYKPGEQNPDDDKYPSEDGEPLPPVEGGGNENPFPFPFPFPGGDEGDEGGEGNENPFPFPFPFPGGDEGDEGGEGNENPFPFPFPFPGGDEGNETRANSIYSLPTIMY